MHSEAKSFKSVKRIGLISAHPNPVPLTISSGLVSTTLQWISSGTNAVEVRVGAPDGELLCSSGGSGCAETGNWVTSGMIFYLQDVSGGKPLSHENTLSTVTIRLALEPLAITPDIYPFAAHIGKCLDCTHIISIGCQAASQLAQFYPKFEIIGVDSGKNLEACKKQYNFGTWIEWNFRLPGKIPVEEKILEHSIILCTNIVENLKNPFYLFDSLKDIMDHSPVCILSTSGNNILFGEKTRESKADVTEGERLNSSEFESILRSKGFNIAFTGSTASTVIDFDKTAFTAVIEKNARANVIHKKAPEDFRVVAILTSYNEEDVIVPSIKYMIDQGISVYLIDNWSTDSTYTLAEQFLGKGLIGIEKFPKEAPSLYYDWEFLLSRKEELTNEIQADWFIHYDVDEIRESPWPEVCLKDAIYDVDKAGFNCINHTLIEFYPIDNNFVPGSDFRSHFKYFEFGKQSGDFIRINAWKNFGQNISLAETGGHEVSFEGRKVYPYNFHIKHYRVRSQSHGEKKIIIERKARWNQDERAKGWHKHYDTIDTGHSFLRSPSELELFDETVFKNKYLIECLSGVGVIKADLIKKVIFDGQNLDVERTADLEAQNATLETKNTDLESRNADLEARNATLETKNTDLETKKIDLEARNVDLESYLFSLSQKWWIRCLLFVNRLLGRKHRLDQR